MTSKLAKLGLELLRKDGMHYFVDVGLRIPIKYDGKFKHDGRKVNVKLLKHKNYINAIDIERNEITEKYWGYNVYQIKELKKYYGKISNIKHYPYF